MPDVDIYPVSVALHKSKFPGLSAVTLYAADNFGEDPERLTPDQARSVAHELIKKANELDACLVRGECH
jgi:hypothetical protein